MVQEDQNKNTQMGDDEDYPVKDNPKMDAGIAPRASDKTVPSNN